MCAHILEVGEDEGPPGDAAGAAGGAEGGAEGGAGNADQGQGVPAGQRQQVQPLPCQPPPVPSRNSPRLNDIQNDTIKPFVTEIGTDLGLIKKASHQPRTVLRKWTS